MVTVLAFLSGVKGTPSQSSSTRRGTPAGRSFPIVGLLLYYAALIALATLLIEFFPGFRQALIAPISSPAPSEVDELLTGGHPEGPGAALPWPGPFGRGLLAMTAMLWALAVALPVAWSLKRTRHLRYDPSLVQTLILLPIVVSGVVLVVKNSLALAFALAGIVAGVRFRQKLEEPEEAVYVLLALGIGLAAGVQALDVALAMSLVFTMVVFSVWRWDLGDIFAGGKGSLLAIGDPNLLAPSLSEARREARGLERAIAEGLKPTGVLLVRASDPEAARRGIEVILGRMATKWQIYDPVAGEPGGATDRFEIPVELKEKVDPATLVAELEARLLDCITAAEYVPLGNIGSD